MRTVAGIKRHPCYVRLRAAQHGRDSTPAQLAAARRDLRSLNVGWLLVWGHYYPSLTSYLVGTGFTFAYRADGVLVYRPGASPSGPPPDERDQCMSGISA